MNYETNSTVDKRKRHLAMCKATGKCDRCPCHGGENVKKKARSDKGKNHRRQ